MQTATLETELVRLELFGTRIGRLLGERVVVNKKGDTFFKYSRLNRAIKVSKRKQLTTESGDKFYMYGLVFPAKDNRVNYVTELIRESDTPLIYFESNDDIPYKPNKIRIFPKVFIGQNTIEMGTYFFHESE